MTTHLRTIGQVALSLEDIDRAEDFYDNVLQLEKFGRFGDILFYTCNGVRLIIEKGAGNQGCVYFTVSDIDLAFEELKERGVEFEDSPHLIAPMPDHDLYMCFFRDSEGNMLALMNEAPKGYVPKAVEGN